MSPTPFRIDVDDAALARIRSRIAEYPWDKLPSTSDWSRGTPTAPLRALCDYWLDDYDWRAQEAELNRFSQFRAAVDGIDLHYLREPGSGPAPMPLLISHGWPGSVVEFTDIVEPLAHPERFGGREEDAFDVIAPSLPGFGFSGPPPAPMGPRAMAAVFNQLMTGTLGYDGYLAQGGDWGGAISSYLGFDHAPSCRAIHINILTMRHVDGPQGPDEETWAQQFEAEQAMEHGYRTIQSTRPDTLGLAMVDNPVGVAAWILEKFHSWSDLRDGDVYSVYTMDRLLTNIMIYLVTESFTSAAWIYYGRREEGGRVLSTDGRRVEVPTAAALFPEEMLRWPPRSYVERLYNVQRWSEMERGGHFAALEQPDALIDDIRAFARQVR